MAIQLRKTRCRASGFTLVEVIVASTLLGIIFLGTVQYFTLSRWQIQKSARKQMAYIAMTSRLERARIYDFDQLEDSLSENSISLVLNGVQGYRTTRVTSVDDSLDGVAPTDTTVPDHKIVTVTFAWFDAENVKDSMSLTFSYPGS